MNPILIFWILIVIMFVLIASYNQHLKMVNSNNVKPFNLCFHCFKRSTQTTKLKKKFPGSPQHRCPFCNKVSVYPITMANRIVMWLFIVMMIIGSFMIIMNGYIPIPGLFGVIIIYGFILDKRRRADFSKAINNEVKYAMPEGWRFGGNNNGKIWYIQPNGDSTYDLPPK